MRKPVRNIKIAVERTHSICTVSYTHLAGTDVIKYPFKIIHHELQIENCRFYDVRGSYATKCLWNGVEIKDIADILGYKRVETTDNYYIIGSEEATKNINKKIEHIMGTERCV